jgi:hypothetical protein
MFSSLQFFMVSFRIKNCSITICTGKDIKKHPYCPLKNMQLTIPCPCRSLFYPISSRTGRDVKIPGQTAPLVPDKTEPPFSDKKIDAHCRA